MAANLFRPQCTLIRIPIITVIGSNIDNKLSIQMNIDMNVLTHCSLMTSNSDIDQGRHWLN